MEIVWTDDLLGEMSMPNSPLLFDSLPSDRGLLTPQDWDLASIESTLSPAVFDPDIGGIEFGGWFEIDQSAAKTEKFWHWNSISTMPVISEQSSSCCSFEQSSSSCCSFLCCSDTSSLQNDNWPILEQIKLNQKIAAQMSPLQKFQERLQRIHRRLGRQQRRKFSLKNGRNNGEKFAKNHRQNGANRIPVLKWREELKNVLKNETIKEKDIRNEKEKRAKIHEII